MVFILVKLISIIIFIQKIVKVILIVFILNVINIIFTILVVSIIDDKVVLMNIILKTYIDLVKIIIVFFIKELVINTKIYPFLNQIKV